VRCATASLHPCGSIKSSGATALPVHSCNMGIRLVSSPKEPSACVLTTHFMTSQSLVTLKWLGLQAGSNVPGNVVAVTHLLSHPAFNINNPNKCVRCWVARHSQMLQTNPRADLDNCIAAATAPQQLAALIMQSST